MNDCGNFVYDLESMEDDTRAAVITNLDTDDAAIVYITVLRPRPSRSVVGGIDLKTCAFARLMIYPLPESLGYNSVFEDIEDCEKHLSNCPHCQKWSISGRPFVFDLGWHIHERIFHNRIQTVLHHQNEWPQSYAAAVKHCTHCSQCNEWLRYLMLTQSCQGVRSEAKHVEQRHAYIRDDVPSKLIDDHIASCSDCQQWCYAAVSCDAVRKAIHYVGANSIDWKFYRHETLRPKVDPFVNTIKC